MKRQARGTARGSDPADAMDVMGGAELLEDRSARISGGGHGRRFGMSIPGAIAGTFLVAALALGAALGPAPSDPAGGTGHHGDGALIDSTDVAGDNGGADGSGTATGGTTDGAIDADGTDSDGASPDKTDEPDGGEPDKTAGPDATANPDATIKPDPTAAPAPDRVGIAIALGLEGTAVVIEWSVCQTDAFVAYKVIRSKDEFATWPLGAGDSLAGVIENQATTRLVDKGVDAGRTYRYKVVALRTWEGATVVACRSDTAAIQTPAPTPKPEPTDGGGATAISISLAIKEGHPFIDWTACGSVDFDYYKVVRSTDSTVSWPKGENDSLVTAVGIDGETKAWDGEAPAGTSVWYRVFCVRSNGDGYTVVAASPVEGIDTPASQPAPDPVALGFEVAVTGEGVVLHWQACSVDNFAYYKVVRSTTNPNPSYMPYTDGTELIGVIESSATTQLVDSSIASGQTIYYRVQCLGYWNGVKVVRGQTAVVAVAIP